MKDDRRHEGGRRGFLTTVAAAPLVIAAGQLGIRPALAATPQCGDEITPRQTAGPFFKPQSPLRNSLIVAGMRGDRLTLSGRILSSACQPIGGALIDFWHCDAQGRYDNRGYRFRGHQFSTEDGAFLLDTLMPGLYPGRTRHIHVIVQAANRRPLVTQLYFPGEALNDSDWIFDSRLLVDMAGDETRRRAKFDFVLDLGGSA
jgi:protocatechuate 3,4-dioxygenase beta subunit